MLRYLGSEYRGYVCARLCVRVWLWSGARLMVCDLVMAWRFAMVFQSPLLFMCVQRSSAKRIAYAYSIYGAVTRSFR